VTLAAGIPDSGSHRYTVPDVATARGRVRVVVRDADGGVGFADGGDDLVIRGSGPLVPPPRGPLLVAKAGVALTLRSGASPAASSYGVYEGAIGAFREVERTTCHVDGSDGRLAEEPGGVVSLEHLPLDGGRWFLLSSSDCQGESELRPWLAPWACGGSG
jgi:hypothetical protein